jgi:hypothetical protein
MPRAAARDRTTPRRPAKARVSKENRQGLAFLLSALAAPFAGASLIGVGLLDIVWAALLGALAAYLGSMAKRGPLLVASMVAVLASRSVTAGIFAGLAIVFAALSTRHLRRRAFFARGLAGGCLAISVLATGAAAPGWVTIVDTLAVGGTIVASGYRGSDRLVRRNLRWFTAGAIAFAAVASAGALAGAAAGAHKIDVGTVELEAGLASARAGDPVGTATHLQQATTALHRARQYITRLGALGRVVPVTAQHVNALSSILDHVDDAAVQATTTAQATDMQDLTVHAGLLDVEELAKLQNPFRRLASSLHQLVVDVHERERSPLLPPLKKRLTTFGDQAERAEREASVAAEGTRQMPGFLGLGGAKHYLVLFTSPSEARGRFGFPASFAEVTMDDGRFLLGEHGSTSAFLSKATVDQSTLDIGGDQLRPYLTFGATRQILSVTVPPDFPTVAKVAGALWAASGRRPVDGVLRFDPAALAAVMSFTGPVRVPSVPEPLTAANVEQYLVYGQYVQFPDEVAPRREVLQQVSDTTFERLVTANLPSPRRLVDAFAPLVRAQHLQITSFHRGPADLFRRVRTDGRFTAPAQDGLMIANINNTANKIDAFLTRSVTYQGHVEDGRVQGSVTISLTNHAPGKDLPLYVIGSATKPPLPKGTNRTTLLVYTAVPGDRVLVDGAVARATPALRTGHWWLHEVALDLAPGQMRTVRVEVDGMLPDPEGSYQLQLLPGGGATPDEYHVDVTAGDRTVRFDGRVPTPTDLG